MNARSSSIFKVCAPAITVIIPLIGATGFIPPGFPLLLRQIVLCGWGVGAILAAERLLFSGTLGESVRVIGFVPARTPAVVVAFLVSVPMWLFLPIFARFNGVAVTLRTDWLALLAGVVLVNGIAEEVIHRGFVFGHLRRGRSFASAATVSAMLFAAQHLYLVLTIGWAPGLASVLLAAFLAFPMAYLFERGGRSIGGPAILHTSSNAPVLIFAFPGSFVATALVPHMGVILIALYLVFAFRRFLTDQPRREGSTGEESSPL